MIRDALFIAQEDLLQLLRQRDVLLWVFVMPGLFFYFIGSVTGGTASPVGDAENPDPIVLIAPSEDDWLVRSLANRLEAGKFGVRFARPGDDVTGDRLILEVATEAEGDSPSTLAARGEPVAVRLTNDHQALGAEFFQLRIARAVYATAADLVLVSEEGNELTQESVREMQQRSRPFELAVSAAGHRERIPWGFEQAVPGIIGSYFICD